MDRPGQLPLFPPSRSVALPATRAEPVGAEPSLLSEAVAAYLAHLTELNRAPHTLASTGLDLAGLVNHLGDLRLVDVTAEALHEHIQWLRDDRSNRTASLRRKIASIKGLFRHAKLTGWVYSDPAAGLIYPPPVNPAVLALRADEEASVMAAAGHDLTWLTLVLLILDCGLKRDEVLALRADDLLLGRSAGASQLSVRRTARAKRARRRSLPLTDRLHAALAHLIGTPLPCTRLVNLSVRGINFVVETIGQRAQLKRFSKLTPEILRDTYAVRRVSTQIDEEERQIELGCSVPQLLRLRRQHDQALLADLGLSPSSDMAARYRQAARELRSR